MRKSVKLVVEQNGQAVELEFQRFTLAQEDEWAKWVREQIISECRESWHSLHTPLQTQMLTELGKSISVGACSLTGGEGVQKAIQGRGLRKFLMMAGKEKHSEMTEEGIYDIIFDHYEDCLKVVQSLLPIKIDLEALMNLKSSDKDPEGAGGKK